MTRIADWVAPDLLVRDDRFLDRRKYLGDVAMANKTAASPSNSVGF